MNSAFNEKYILLKTDNIDIILNQPNPSLLLSIYVFISIYPSTEITAEYIAKNLNLEQNVVDEHLYQLDVLDIIFHTS